MAIEPLVHLAMDWIKNDLDSNLEERTFGDDDTAARNYEHSLVKTFWFRSVVLS